MRTAEKNPQPLSKGRHQLTVRGAKLSGSYTEHRSSLLPSAFHSSQKHTTTPKLLQKGSLLPVPADDRVSCDSSLWAGELLPGTPRAPQCNKASWMLAEQRNSPAGATARQAAGLCLEHSEQARAQRGVAAGKITRGKPRRSCPTHQAFASIASLKSQLRGVPPSLLPTS